MIACYTKYRVPGPQRAAFDDSALRHRAAARAAPGNVLYEFSVGLDDPDTVFALQVWESAAHLDTHRAAAYHDLRLAELAQMDVVVENITFFEARPLEGLLRATADHLSDRSLPIAESRPFGGPA